VPLAIAAMATLCRVCVMTAAAIVPVGMRETTLTRLMSVLAAAAIRLLRLRRLSRNSLGALGAILFAAGLAVTTIMTSHPWLPLPDLSVHHAAAGNAASVARFGRSAASKQRDNRLPLASTDIVGALVPLRRFPKSK